MASTPSKAQRLCLVCGLCCDGALFKDVELRSGDEAARLSQLGMSLEVRRGQTRLTQPCAALGADCRCGIYADRPAHCREFECALLQAVNRGRMQSTEARRCIRLARQRAERVRRLLRELGDRDEHVALSIRFRRLSRRLAQDTSDKEAAGAYSRLTLAMHALNVLLREKFYPDPEK
jgi:Fe-S-cluster containining protein